LLWKHSVANSENKGNSVFFPLLDFRNLWCTPLLPSADQATKPRISPSWHVPQNSSEEFVWESYYDWWELLFRSAENKKWWLGKWGICKEIHQTQGKKLRPFSSAHSLKHLNRSQNHSEFVVFTHMTNSYWVSTTCFRHQHNGLKQEPGSHLLPSWEDNIDVQILDPTLASHGQVTTSTSISFHFLVCMVVLMKYTLTELAWD
jgi:hypothetical protein